ncbi:MAG: GTPase ObgE [Bacilli bacterium]|jgi:GTP-binding protein|nr:GTPase ObgE [Bacilli bacterium]
MLIDRCVIEVRSGKGGDGAISFLHDRNTAMGGPDGGNGGRGGSVYLVAKANVNTLFSFRHSRMIAAEDGEKGYGKLMYGHNAKDVFVEVPRGTIVSDEASGQILADLKEEGQSVLIAKGGKGGRGNASYKSSRMRAPRIAENGDPGERRRLVLELRMLADAALIGFPSVGKSTFLNVTTHANAMTAEWDFTTLEPILGVVDLPDGSTFVLADMPGLIKGAHEGKGLGIRFLRHIERCRVLIHLVAMDGKRDPYEAYLTINEELKDYDADLEKRPQIVVASLMDSDGADERRKAFEKKAKVKTYPLCSLTHEGVSDIVKKAEELIATTPEFPLKGLETGGLKVYDGHLEKEPEFRIEKIRAGYFRVVGEKVEYMQKTTNLKNDDGVARLIHYLDRIGVEEALKKAGAKDGDTIVLGSFEFEYTS